MLLHLTNAPRDYAWGSGTLLAELEGRAPSGAPEAEVWFGDHPGDPADVVGGGTLDAVTGGTLPYLLKLLAAAQPLSIQVHPTLAQAKEGWERESGLAADPAALAWWELFNAVKGQGIWTSAAKEYADGGYRDPVLGFSGWYTARRHDKIIADRLVALEAWT